MTPPQKLEKIGRYQVLERVGKGGMGVLYRGFDPVLDREIAIKLMHADFTDDTEQMRPRFYREARAAAKLQHRNIVTIFEFAEESNVPYIVMEFLKGLPLGARMNQPPPLTLDDKLNVIAQLCDGLAYAHEQGVVHRDVKPDNVFLLEDGSIKLLDFGIAKLTTSTLTRQGDVLGSASYMSPEQVSGSESVDGRADVFSAGVVLYELLSGRKPFEGDSPTSVIVKILKEPPTPIESITTGLPANVIAVVMRALQKNPAERYQSAEALGRDLQTVRKSLHPSLSRGNLDETRLASSEVMQALHNDYQRSRGEPVRIDTALSMAPTIAPGGAPAVPGAPSNPTISSNPTVSAAPASAQPAAPTPTAVTTQTAITSAPPEKSWMVPALAGALVAVLAVGGFVMYSTRRPAPETTAPAPADPAAGAASTQTPATPGTNPAAAAQPPATTDPATQVAAVDPAQTAAAAPVPAPTPDPVVAQVAGASALAPRTERAPAPVAAPVAPTPDPSIAARAAEAAAAAAATSNAAVAGPTGTLYIDFVNNFPDGSVEVEVDGRRRWSEKLGFSQNVGGLSRLKIQRASENLGSELKMAPGNHRVMVTVLNADGEVRDVATTSVSIYDSKAATLKIRQTRLRNKIQLETVVGEPDGK